MRLSPGEWFDDAIYLAFLTSIVFQTLMESGSNNPVFMKPWLPEQQVVGHLGVNYMEDGGG